MKKIDNFDKRTKRNECDDIELKKNNNLLIEDK